MCQYRCTIFGCDWNPHNQHVSKLQDGITVGYNVASCGCAASSNAAHHSPSWLNVISYKTLIPNYPAVRAPNLTRGKLNSLISSFIMRVVLQEQRCLTGTGVSFYDPEGGSNNKVYISGVPRGGWGVQPPPEIPKALQKIVSNSTRLWKLLKIAEFRMPTHQDVQKKGSKILKLRRFAFVLH